MEPVEKKTQIDALPSLVAGIEFRFRGAQTDVDGEPTGEFIDQMLVVPPLNLNSIKAMQSKLLAFGTTADNTESMEALCEALQRALRRNYRGVPLWLIEQTVDVSNMADLMQALMDLSGMKRKAIEAGKAKAADAAVESTGTSSTAT